MNFAPKISENLAKMTRKPFITIVSPCLEAQERERGGTGISQEITRHNPISVFEALECIGDGHQTRTHYCCLEG